MAQITDYGSLSTAINDYAGARSETQATLDIIIGLAEADFNLMPSIKTYRRETTDTTLTTDANGEVTLPSGFLRMRSIVRDYSGAVPLIAVSWEELKRLNPYAQAGTPTHYAISGTKLKVAEIATDDFLATYESSLTGLSSANTTNWLITLAPQAYLSMCLSYMYARIQEFSTAQALRAQAIDILSAVGIQSDLAQYGNTQIELDQAVP